MAGLESLDVRTATAPGVDKKCEGCGTYIADGVRRIVMDGAAEQTHWHIECLALLPACIASALDAAADAYECDSIEAQDKSRFATTAAASIRRALRATQ